MLHKLQVQVKNITQSQVFVDYAQKKLASLEKLVPHPDSIRWNLRLSKEGGPHKGDIFHAEAQMITDKKNFGAEAHGETPYEAIDELRSELNKKITHHKDKRITRFKRGAAFAKELLRGGK